MSSAATQVWTASQKTRRTILKELEKVNKSNVDGDQWDRFQELEMLIAKYRLGCVETLWLDIEYASRERVEATLWQTHSLINSAYRKVLSRLSVSNASRAVSKRKVEKSYNAFLKVTQFFYKGYVQRLCARYAMPELQRVAKSARLEEMSVPAEDRVNATASGVGSSVVSSCHMTLIYLGDLSRYRTLLRPRHERKFDSALAYYALANELLPKSGFSHHQMGLIFLEEKQHFQIVYNFYRAMAAERPHPNAKGNIEVEFREVLRPVTPRTQSPREVFCFWFVRLHAYFYRGEEFSQQAELEEEVLHRFEATLKTCQAEPILMHMLLINICAYQVAQEKTKVQWTAAGSLSCQYILCFNIRILCAIAQILGIESHGLLASRRELLVKDKESMLTAESQHIFSTMLDTGLPLLRVYMTWLCSYRLEILEYQDHLEPHIGVMLRTLSRTLTDIWKLAADGSDAWNKIPHLFAEDIETLGVTCLESVNVPLPCRLQLSPKDHELKPRLEEVEAAEVNVKLESLFRSLDIIRMAAILANIPTFPFSLIKVTTERGETGQILFLEKDQLAASRADPTSSAAASDTREDVILQRTTRHPIEPEPVFHTSYAVSTLFDNNARLSSDISGELCDPRHNANRRLAPAAFEYEDSVESHLYDLVNDFLVPPEVEAKSSVASGNVGNSYGRNASEIFNAAVPTASPGPGSATAKSFPSLPWDYFYTPTPQIHGQVGTSTQAWHGGISPAGATHLDGSARPSRPGEDEILPDSPTAHEASKLIDRSTNSKAITSQHAETIEPIPLENRGIMSNTNLEQVQSKISHNMGWYQATNWGSLQHALLREHLVEPTPDDLVVPTNKSTLPTTSNSWSLPPEKKI